MKKYKSILILLTITFLWQNLLGACPERSRRADVLRPRPMREKSGVQHSLIIDESAVRLARERRIVLAKGELRPAWSRGLRVYYDFVRNSARPGRDSNAFGNFSDLRFVFEHAKKLGFNAIFLMPLCDTATHDPNIEDSPYSLLSAYALDPRYIDWEATGIPGKTLEEHWNHFRQDLPADFELFAQRNIITQYAHLKALRAFRDRIERYSIDNFDRFASLADGELERTEKYRQVCDLILFEQYVARKQLIEAIAYAHKLGLFVGYDQPFYRAMNGADRVFNPAIFEWRDGLIEPVVHRDPGQTYGQRWGDRDAQAGLGQYNWWEVIQRGYEPLIGPMKYFVEEIGFDWIRGDAFHHGFLKAGLYEKVTDLCKQNGVLFAPETLGCQNGVEVNGACEGLGMLPVDTTANIDEWKNDARAPSRYDKWRFITQLIYERRHLPRIWTPVHHDNFRLVHEYAQLFTHDTPHQIRARTMYAFFGLALPNYSMMFGDEYLEEKRVNEYGRIHPWKEPSPYCNPRGDISDCIRRINEIREEHQYTSDFGNLHFISVSDSEVIFTRWSIDGKSTLLCVLNPTNAVRKARAPIDLRFYGVNIRRPFTLRDVFNKEDIDFIPGQNVYDDGSIYYELAPGHCHVFEISEGVRQKQEGFAGGLARGITTAQQSILRPRAASERIPSELNLVQIRSAVIQRTERALSRIRETSEVAYEIATLDSKRWIKTFSDTLGLRLSDAARVELVFWRSPRGSREPLFLIIYDGGNEFVFWADPSIYNIEILREEAGSIGLGSLGQIFENYSVSTPEKWGREAFTTVMGYITGINANVLPTPSLDLQLELTYRPKPGLGVSSSEIMPHRGRAYVNSRIIGVMIHLLRLRSYCKERGIEPKEAKRFLELLEDRIRGYDRPIEKVPLEKIARTENLEFHTRDGNALKFRVVKLPVNELGRFNGEPFWAHIGFRERIIWVAVGDKKSPRSEADIELDILHEIHEYERALRKKEDLGFQTMAEMAEWRDRASQDAIDFFQKAHKEAWEDVRSWCREMARRCGPERQKEKEKYDLMANKASIRIAGILSRTPAWYDTVGISSITGIGIVSHDEVEAGRTATLAMECI